LETTRPCSLASSADERSALPMLVRAPYGPSPRVRRGIATVPAAAAATATDGDKQAAAQQTVHSLPAESVNVVQEAKGISAAAMMSAGRQHSTEQHAAGGAEVGTAITSHPARQDVQWRRRQEEEEEQQEEEPVELSGDVAPTTPMAQMAAAVAAAAAAQAGEDRDGSLDEGDQNSEEEKEEGAGVWHGQIVQLQRRFASPKAEIVQVLEHTRGHAGKAARLLKAAGGLGQRGVGEGADPEPEPEPESESFGGRPPPPQPPARSPGSPSRVVVGWARRNRFVVVDPDQDLPSHTQAQLSWCEKERAEEDDWAEEAEGSEGSAGWRRAESERRARWEAHWLRELEAQRQRVEGAPSLRQDVLPGCCCAVPAVPPPPPPPPAAALHALTY
jgi:hypothetical protein